MPKEPNTLSLKFVSSGWNIKFYFSVTGNYKTIALAQKLFTHFSFKNYINFDISQFPSRSGCSPWSDSWYLTANGGTIRSMNNLDMLVMNNYLHDLNLSKIDRSDFNSITDGSSSLIDDGLKNGDLLRIKIDWSTSCFNIATKAKKRRKPPKKPPEIEL